jgi:hypothetical protein
MSIFLFGMTVLLWACGPSVEDSVTKLGGTPEERDEGRQELLLAKDRSVGSLLEALENPRFTRGRPELVEVLVGLMTRVEDARIEEALIRHLVEDHDPQVRARIAHKFGLFHRREGIETLLKALEDEAGEVRYQALWALGEMEREMDFQQREMLRLHARKRAADEYIKARREAMIRVEAFMDDWLREAHRLALTARLAEDESLFAKALTYSPSSKRANYGLARFYLDNGQKERGFHLLRQHGMLLDVSRLQGGPQVDGRLEEGVWQTAARADSFFQHSMEHYAAVPSDVRTEIYLGYTSQALYVGFIGHDAHPESLVVKTHHPDQDIWYEDAVELFIDPHFDHRDYVHIGINSLGVTSDHSISTARGRESFWNADAEVAAYVGEDFWSLEYRLDFGQREVPQPSSGDLWGFNFVRVFRGVEYSQWVRTYEGGHRLDEFGLLVFR